MSWVVPAAGIPSGVKIIIHIYASPSGTTITGLSDSRGNSYNLNLGFTASNRRVEIWSSITVATPLQGGDTITVQFSGGGSTAAMHVCYGSGLVSPAGKDQDGTASGSTSAPSVTASGATAQNNEIAFGSIACVSTATISAEAAGWTPMTEVVVGGNTRLHVAYQMLPLISTPTYAPTLSSSVFWQDALITFKGA
jgi:hypothetical protein